MNRYKLSLAGIDVKEGIHRFNENKALYEKFLNQFPDNELYTQLKERIEQGDAKKAFESCHALKGVCGNLSMNDLFNAICPLTEELRSGSLAKAPELFDAVTVQYERVIQVLNEEIAKNEEKSTTE